MAKCTRTAFIIIKIGFYGRHFRPIVPGEIKWLFVRILSGPDEAPGKWKLVEQMGRNVTFTSLRTEKNA